MRMPNPSPTAPRMTDTVTCANPHAAVTCAVRNAVHCCARASAASGSQWSGASACTDASVMAATANGMNRSGMMTLVVMTAVRMMRVMVVMCARVPVNSCRVAPRRQPVQPFIDPLARDRRKEDDLIGGHDLRDAAEHRLDVHLRQVRA